MARKFAALALIFAAFYMAGHYWIRWRNRVADDTHKSTRLVDCDPNQVKRVTLIQKFGGKSDELHFERIDSKVEGLPVSAQLAAAEWRIITPSAGEADSALLTRIASMFCEFYDPIPAKSQGVAAENGARTAVEAKIEFSEDGGPMRTAAIRFVSVTQDRMSLVEHEGKAYKIMPELFRLASREPDAFLNYRVVRMSPDNVHAASFIIDGRERFTLEREGGEWRVLTAGKIVGKGSEEAGKFVNRLSTLRALEIAVNDFPREKCERGKHKVRVELSGVANKKETLYFDDHAKGKLAACSTARPTRFLVHADLMRYLNLPVKKLIAVR